MFSRGYFISLGFNKFTFTEFENLFFIFASDYKPSINFIGLSLNNYFANNPYIIRNSP